MIARPLIGERPGTKTPTATPYLLIPAFDGDAGARPISALQAVTNGSIQATGEPDWHSIRLSCVVRNSGGVRCAVGLAAFYVGSLISERNLSHMTATPQQVQADVKAVGYSSFQVPQGGTATIHCPNVWKVGGARALEMGVLVQVYDMFTDRMTAPFDAPNDRHVARNDGATKHFW